MVVPPPTKVKIRLKTSDCIFIGYTHNSTAYRFLVHESNIPNIHKNMIIESRNASFFAVPCKSKEKPNSSKQVLETIYGNSQDENNDSEVEPKCSKKVRIEKIL